MIPFRRLSSKTVLVKIVQNINFSEDIFCGKVIFYERVQQWDNKIETWSGILKVILHG